MPGGIINWRMKVLMSRNAGAVHLRTRVANYIGQAEQGEDASVRRLFYRGTAGAFLVQVGGAGLGMLAQFIVARLLGAEQYGAYALTLSWVSTISVFALLGQDTSVVKFLPVYAQSGDWRRAFGLRRGISAMILVSSLTIAVGGSVIVYLVPQRINPTLQRSLWTGFVLLPVLTQLQLSGALHRALKRAISSGVFNNILRPLLLIVLVLVTWFGLGDYLNAPLALGGSVCAAFMSLVVSSVLLVRIWPENARGVEPTYEWRRWSTVGLQLSLLSIIVIAGNRLDVLIFGALAGSREVGPYYVAVQMAGFALYALQATNVVLAPLIAERYSVRDLRGLQLAARRAARIGFGVAVLASTFFALTGHWLLGFFGPEYPAAYGALLVLLLGYCISTSFGEVGFMMSMTEYQKQAAVFVAFGVGINCVVSWLLIPRFGMLGAACGAALSIITWRGLAMHFVITRMKINPSVLGAAA